MGGRCNRCLLARLVDSGVTGLLRWVYSSWPKTGGLEFCMDKLEIRIMGLLSREMGTYSYPSY